MVGETSNTQGRKKKPRNIIVLHKESSIRVFFRFNFIIKKTKQTTSFLFDKMESPKKLLPEGGGGDTMEDAALPDVVKELPESQEVLEISEIIGPAEDDDVDEVDSVSFLKIVDECEPPEPFPVAAIEDLLKEDPEEEDAPVVVEDDAETTTEEEMIVVAAKESPVPLKESEEEDIEETKIIEDIEDDSLTSLSLSDADPILEQGNCKMCQ